MKTLAEQILEKKSAPEKNVNEDMGSGHHMNLKMGDHHVNVHINYGVGKAYKHGEPMGDDNVEMQARLEAALKSEAEKFLAAAKAKLSGMQKL